MIATKEQLARIDRRRKKKASNEDWTNPNDPSARITKMEDGRTKLAYKAEHGVDLASGALFAVTVQPADRWDTTSYVETLDAAQQEAKKSHPQGIEEVVMDKGYHSGAVLVNLAEREIRGYNRFDRSDRTTLAVPRTYSRRHRAGRVAVRQTPLA